MTHLNRSCLLHAPPSRGRGVSQVMLSNVVFGLGIVLGLSRWAKTPLSGPNDPPLFPRNPFYVPFTLKTELTV